MKKFESSKLARLATFIVFVVFGISAVIVNSVNRDYQDHQQETDRNTITNISGQLDNTLKFLTQSKGQPNELERRKHIVDTLRSEYIVTHPQASAAIIMGSSNPPDDWMKKRLAELGETWPYFPLKQQQPPSAPAKAELAAIEFTIVTPQVEERPDLVPLKETTLPLVDGVVTIPISARAVGQTPAKDATLIIRICVGCEYAEEPNGLGITNNDPHSPDRRTPIIPVIYPNALIDKINIKVRPNKSLDRLAVKCMYACDNCGATLPPDKGQVLLVHLVKQP